jgi:Peptidase inhibitor family I36
MRLRLFAAALITTTGALAIPGTAHAAGQDGVIESNEFVFYYSLDYSGSYTDFAVAKSDLGPYDFVKPGLAGYGTPVRNNSASVRNKRNQAARVYYSPGYAGVSDYVDPLASRNLVATRNDNASFRWV